MPPILQHLDKKEFRDVGTISDRIFFLSETSVDQIKRKF